MTELNPPFIEIGELRRLMLNIESVLQIIEEKPDKDRIPSIRSVLGRHMSDMDSSYLNLVKALDNN